jgi:hypothetical protein
MSIALRWLCCVTRRPGCDGLVWTAISCTKADQNCAFWGRMGNPAGIAKAVVFLARLEFFLFALNLIQVQGDSATAAGAVPLPDAQEDEKHTR